MINLDSGKKNIATITWLVVIMTLFVFSLTACQSAPEENYGKAPPAQSDNAKNSDELSGEVASRKINVDKLVNYNNQTITMDLVGKRQTLNIDNALVGSPSVLSNVSIFTAKPYFISEELLLLMAFDNISLQDIMKTDKSGVYNGIDYAYDIYECNGDVAVRSSLYGMFGIDLTSSLNLNVLDRSDENVQGTKEIDITAEQAISIAKEFLKGLSISTHAISVTEYGQLSYSDPYYLVILTPMIDEIPIYSSVTQSAFQGRAGLDVDTTIEITVTEKGVAAVTAYLREYTPTGAEYDSVISLETAIEMLETNIDTIPQNMDEPISSIYFGYVEYINESDELLVTPAWIFSSGINRNSNIHVNIYIDAITGAIIR